MAQIISPKERAAAIQALRSGVVPRLGIQHVQVGRAAEVDEVISDVTRVAEGGCAARFAVGDYGSGKTFFLSLARTIAAEKKLVVMHADLSPDRRLHANGGQARLLCAELIRSMATRTKPEGGALGSIVERFLGEARTQAEAGKVSLPSMIHQLLEPIRDLACGYDTAAVIVKYCEGVESDNEDLKAAALRWLRAEYALKTEARDALGVRTIVDDVSVYDHLKAIAGLIRLAGYAGTFIVMDEMVNLYKIVNAQSRNANYEQLLRIVNDVLQGSADRLGFYFGATPETVTDTRRGIFSYEALRSRLAENSFAKMGITDLTGPIIRLQALTQEELFVLLSRLRALWAGGDESKFLVPDEALEAFLAHSQSKVGASAFRTPRNTIKAFLDLLAVLEQAPSIRWQDLLSQVEIKSDDPAPAADIDDESNGTKGNGAPVAEATNALRSEAPARPAAPAPAEPASDDSNLASFRL